MSPTTHHIAMNSSSFKTAVTKLLGQLIDLSQTASNLAEAYDTAVANLNS